VIYDELAAGRVVPFLGAGAPLYARNPTTTPWLRNNDAIDYLPTASELAKYLARKTQLPDREHGELTKMAQYYEAVLGSDPLRRRLREIFSHQQPPTPLHDFLASVPQPLLIVTTNYDDLMERALAAHGRPYHVVANVTDQDIVLWWHDGKSEPETVLPNLLDIELDETFVVYKIHGAIDRHPKRVGSYVITEDDYIEFLTRMTRHTVIPDIFAEPFQTRPFLFLGYGLYDWNLRVILNRIQEFRKHPKFRSWAIETMSKRVEQKLWKDRGVDVYDNLTLEQFVAELTLQRGPAPARAGGNS
jgi:hypothetical protein